GGTLHRDVNFTMKLSIVNDGTATANDLTVWMKAETDTFKSLSVPIPPNNRWELMIEDTYMEMRLNDRPLHRRQYLPVLEAHWRVAEQFLGSSKTGSLSDPEP